MSAVSDRFRLDGRVAIVTGASAGLGVTLARVLAEAGADVVLAARRVEPMQATAALVQGAGRRALVVAADVGEPEDCRRVVAETVEAFGRLDVLVNNAGTGRVTPALKESPDDFRRVIDINLNGCHWMAYAASKAGLLGLTRDLATQWTRRRGIRVNAVAPGFFRTEMTQDDMAGTEALMDRILMGRMGDPEELAAAVLFLASDASSYVTGQAITIDGGFTAT